MTHLRKWQQEAMNGFIDNTETDFLVSATPGAGKTTLALSIARELLAQKKIKRVMVVVPTDALRRQWADESATHGIHLMPVSEAVDYDKDGYHGCVVTYQQLASGVGADVARRACKTPTLAIIDEIHHAGDTHSWGTSLRTSIELATKRLALTGTPWRRDSREAIPFVTYDKDGKVAVNYAYEYGDAVLDDVCRRVEFHSYDGEARWTDPARAMRTYKDRDPGDDDPVTAHFSAKLSADMDPRDVSAALDAVYHPNYAWLPTVLDEANTLLDDIRVDVPDAAGLIIADQQWQALKYADLIEDITGEAPPVVISDPIADPGSKIARQRIEKFRNGTGRWIVAVKMISEGVDIPRLAVGVYASKISSALFFRQVVGRFVRVRPGESLNARLLMPCVPELVAHARDIEDELRHKLDQIREDIPCGPDDDNDGDDKPDRNRSEREPLAAGEAEFAHAILGGEEYGPEAIEAAREACKQLRIPVQYAMNLVPILPQGGQFETSVRDKPNQPKDRQEKMLREEVTNLVGRLAYRYAETHEDRQQMNKTINTKLLQQGFPPRAKATIDDLYKIRDYLYDQIATS